MSTTAYPNVARSTIQAGPSMKKARQRIGIRSIALAGDAQGAIIEATEYEKRARLERLLALPAFDSLPPVSVRVLVEGAVRDARDAVRSRARVLAERRQPFSAKDLISPAFRQHEAGDTVAVSKWTELAPRWKRGCELERGSSLSRERRRTAWPS